MATKKAKPRSKGQVTQYHIQSTDIPASTFESAMKQFDDAANASPSGAALLTLVPSARSVRPNGVLDVDVFVEGAPDLRAYQIALGVTDGRRGTIAIDDVWIDAHRRDYVFGRADSLSATHVGRGMLVNALPEGGVDAVSGAYLGTFRVRASSDALGGFRLSVGFVGSTFLRDSQSGPIAVRTVPITVLAAERQRGR